MVGPQVALDDVSGVYARLAGGPAAPPDAGETQKSGREALGVVLGPALELVVGVDGVHRAGEADPSDLLALTDAVARANEERAAPEVGEEAELPGPVVDHHVVAEERDRPRQHDAVRQARCDPPPNPARRSAAATTCPKPGASTGAFQLYHCSLRSPLPRYMLPPESTIEKS